MRPWTKFRHWLLSLKDSRPNPTTDELTAALATALEDFLAIMPADLVEPDCFLVGLYWFPAVPTDKRPYRFMDVPVIVDSSFRDEIVYLRGRRLNATTVRYDKRRRDGAAVNISGIPLVR